MSEPFYQHLFPSRFKVLGHWLPPLSLWHVAALEAVRSPFASRQGNVDLADIQVAVRICRTRWPKQPNLKPSLVDCLHAYRYRGSKRKVEEQGRILQAHINAYSAQPRLWHSNDIGSDITAPAVLFRVAGLAKLGCFTLGEIWNDVTPSFASWLLLSIAEREGADVKFWRDGDDNPVPEFVEPRTEAEMRAFAKSQGFGGAKLELFMSNWKERRKRRG